MGEKKKGHRYFNNLGKKRCFVCPSQCSKTSLLKGAAQPSSLSTHWIKENTESTKNTLRIIEADNNIISFPCHHVCFPEGKGEKQEKLMLFLKKDLGKCIGDATQNVDVILL